MDAEEWRKAFKAVLENPPKANVDRTVADGEELPYCGGIVVVNTLDLKTATESLKALARYDIETVICYHGGLYRGNANQRIAELANA